MHVELKRRVVALFGVVQMNEEEDVGPDVMFFVDVMLKTLQQQLTAQTGSLTLSGYSTCLHSGRTRV